MKQEKEKLNKELEALSPLMAALQQKGDGFQVPEAYFEQTTEAVFQRLENSKTAQRKIRILKFRRLAAAATVTGVTAMALLSGKLGSNASESDLFPVLTQTEIETYILENIHDFETDFLLESGADLSLSADNWLPEVDQFNDSDSENLIDQLIGDMEDSDIESIF